MTIDLNITYDDLSGKCKQLIQKLRDMGYHVNIVYPSIKRDDTWIGTYSIPVNDTNIASTTTADGQILYGTNTLHVVIEDTKASIS